MLASRVFLTGASSGIGEAMVRRYAVAGAVIGLVARREAVLAALAHELEAQGAKVQVFAGDVIDTAFMHASANAFVKDAGGVDLVVANAGVGIQDTTRSGDASKVAWLMQVNVIGVTNTVLPFVPAMLAQRSGVLSAVSSFAGHRAMPGRTAYCASKAAVTAFMDGLRLDLADTGVHAMTFCPGYVKTPLSASNQGMIFVIDSEDAISTMVAAVERRARTVTFPWQMNVLQHILKLAPESVVRKLAPPARTTSSA